MAEMVYGTHIGGEESHVMSEKVQSLAATVYKEFEKVISRYDEDVVKELMPLVVGILENLDGAYVEKQELDVEIELLREDNEQLLTQYEREKQLRKGAEQKYLEMEDAVEGEKKDLEDKVESLESIVRMLELKSKNAADHVSRLEEKEAEMKKEYSKLHERYTELFKTHMDYMERTKILMGTDKIAELSGNSPRVKGGFHMPSLRPVSIGPGITFPIDLHRSEASPMGYDLTSPQSARDSNVSLKSELSDLDSPEKAKHTKEAAVTSDKEQLTDSIDVTEKATALTAPVAQTSPPQSTPKDEKADQATEIPAPSSKSVVETRGMVIQEQGAPKVAIPAQIRHEEWQTSGHPKEAVVMRCIPSGAGAVQQQRSIPCEDDGFEEDQLPADFGLSQTLAHIVATTPELEESQESVLSHGSNGKRKSVRNDSSIFDELTVQGTDMIAEVDFGADITGREVNPADYASSDSEENEQEDEEGETERDNDADSVSDNFFGMGKELENLILENTELLATKNALNIVKDDLIAKVDELTSEQEILREEINSLQAVRSRLQQRIAQLEEELKKTKEEIEKKTQATREEEEEDVPMAQRKRFTRVEMARVLMERNQYKERLMELQEAVRWTEMIRASREHPGELNTGKKKSSVWNFFNNLFSSSNKPKRPLPVATVKYNAPTTHVQPVGDPNKKNREKMTSTQGQGSQKTKAYDFLQDDITSEKVKKEREKERREQYKQVRAHVKKEDGRLQAYGWSLPAKFTPPREVSNRSHISVPVPVYCRPLYDDLVGVKIWCAAGVNLTGGRTRDGGSIVGASVFYSNVPEEQEQQPETKDEVEKLNKELKEHEKEVKSSEQEHLSSLVWISTSMHNSSRVTVVDANNPGDILDNFRISSSHILCIASIPGAMESDYPVAEEVLKAEAPVLPKETVVSSGTSSNGSGENAGIGGITFVQCAVGPSSRGHSPENSPMGSPRSSSEFGEEAKVDLSSATKGDEQFQEESEKTDTEREKESARDSGSPQQDVEEDASEGKRESKPVMYRATGSPPSSGATTPTDGDSKIQRISINPPDIVRDGISPLPTENELQYEEAEKMSSLLPTMWMGGQSGSLYVHSSVAQWRRCIHSVKLRDSVLGIVHVKGRVFVALADGTVAIFHRAADGQWDLLNYHLLDLGRPKQSIRCMTVVAGSRVWCGYKNRIHIINPKEMSIETSFDAHPRKESQVRQLCWVGDGVWVSIRLDSTLRLYHAYTHQHLQDVDIEPYVSKMLGTGKLGFSFVRITAMLISCNRLWIGTGNGVIISVPLSESNKQSVMGTGAGSGTTISGSVGRPGGVIRVYSNSRTDSVTPGSFIPYCSMAQAQLSFHGHKDAVKFFVAVPVDEASTGGKTVSKLAKIKQRGPHEGLPRKGMSAASDDSTQSSVDKNRLEASPALPTNSKLILSGGEGYVDFRMGDDEEHTEPMEEVKPESLSKLDRSHLIVWQVTAPQ
ncbi:C-Jun-amino-terminal kinase-interacting protein 4-like isoform X6 [Pomacea canaliculata]|uniref:C-Jun-amino-terminal kinase-interacting protein 4-like isoform X6 n=1 Tax=Pomacea canaliculata TaxID=400727 RepID=UPI000D72864A|nr:C-Jun-amino-terminal kinase-interacting protein 4-like isoform X6 [Pomacea canaliculata]